MTTTVKTSIVKIGNSCGIRIPKVLLEQTGIAEHVEIEARAHQLVLRPIVKSARQGWDEKFRQMVESGDDALLDENTSSQWDTKEWQW